jgi:hypothetical protein
MRQSASRTAANYRLLSRQTQYGAIGMYASVADGMRFLNRQDFTLTPDLGEVAAEAFCEETELPGSVRRAIHDKDAEVGLSTLTEWGNRAHVDAQVKTGEAKCLLEALNSNAVRSAMAALLDVHRWKGDEETELARLARIASSLRKSGQHHALREAITCILEFEGCYQVVLLAFERLVWLCRHHSAASITLTELNEDFVLQLVRERLPAQRDRFFASLDSGTELSFLRGLDNLADVRRFLEKVSAAVKEVEPFIDALLSRHTDVQRGKFDRGRRKMPWLERNNSCVSLTMTRSGGLNFEATMPEHIAAHPYRLNAADALIRAGSKAAQS